MAKRMGLGWVAAAAMLAACQVNVHTTASPKATASDKVAAASATPHASGTATPAPAPTIAPGTRLVKPTGDVTTLVGHIAIDASYVISNNAGTLINGQVGGVLAAGATSLGADGSLLSDTGGSLISDSGGNIVTASGGGILSDNSEGLISDHGVGLISDHGVGLIGKTKFRVLAADKPAYGAVLPAAGVELDVRDLKTGQLLPIGTDNAGKPVYSVYTNITGGYTIYPATGNAQNVLVEAKVPGTSDPRQLFSLVAPTQGEATLDEDTALSSREIQEILAGRLQQFMVGDPASWMCLVDASQTLSEPARAVLTTAIQDLHDHARTAGMTSDPATAAAVRAIAWRCAQSALSHVQLDQIIMGANGDTDWGKNPGETQEPALQAMTEVFRDVRQAAIPKLAANPTFFEGYPYFQYANGCDPSRYQIKKPSDINGFLIDEYLIDGSDPGLYWTGTVFDSLAINVDARGVMTQNKANTAMDTLATSMATLVFGNQHGELDEIHAIIASYDPQAPIDPSIPSARPSSCPRPVSGSGQHVTACFGNTATVQP